ncbi:Fasciclin-like arabinogalactan family protein [Thalictrum thalictroides]|uniref:Fasciclin-like arabinogalactan family protein n=1 Tax=Thalictrum thalictroides TaxID=46969 RepID=A0A7J6X8N8_THATH|nr:Fasciclin-like arabinogalactan family protein [Thalictrum thalictroides]
MGFFAVLILVGLFRLVSSSPPPAAPGKIPALPPFSPVETPDLPPFNPPSQPPSTSPVNKPVKIPELPRAIFDMQSKSYFGFVILLNLLNATTKSALGQQVTFFMPSDQQLARSTISPGGLDDFVLTHTVPEPLIFSSLARTPNGTLIQSFTSNQFFRISNIGRRVFINNAHIVTRNVCSSDTIKCHGISTVIDTSMNQTVSW